MRYVSIVFLLLYDSCASCVYSVFVAICFLCFRCSLCFCRYMIPVRYVFIVFCRYMIPVCYVSSVVAVICVMCRPLPVRYVFIVFCCCLFLLYVSFNNRFYFCVILPPWSCKAIQRRGNTTGHHPHVLSETGTREDIGSGWRTRYHRLAHHGSLSHI